MGAAKKQKLEIADYQQIISELEHELSLLKRAPQKFEPMAEISKALAHEINTPLSVILMKTEYSLKLLESDAFDNNKVIQSLEKTKVSVNKISEMVRSLHAYSQMNFTKPLMPEDLISIVKTSKDYIEDFYNAADTKLELDLPDTCIMVPMRKSEIGQVMANLLKNALDAVSDLDEKWVKVTIEENKDYVLLAVTDSGHGINKELQEKIFTPFYSLKKKAPGMGIGLSLSKTIVGAHGGDLYLDDNCANTKFVVKLLKKPPELFYHSKEKTND